VAPPKTIRVNTLVTDREGLARELQKEGVEVRPAEFSPVGLVAASGGLEPTDKRYYIQDEASQLVPYLVAPEPGEVVCDACAAPGGKATGLAQLMGNTGVVYAVDRHGGRLKTVAEAAKRLGADIVRTFEADASGTLPFAPDEGFDAVLLDAPCTGLGVLRRTPDIKLRRTEEDITRSAEKQGSLIENVSRYVRKGGRLVYSVCTFEPEETTGVVDRFLSSHGEFTVEDARVNLPPGCGGLVDERGFMRTYPHTHGMDGFFAVRLRKE
jgi:16S rRNA (cytosine967-C5)-methyltransferase